MSRPPYLTIPEVAARCGGVDRSRVYIWIKRGVTVRGRAGRFYLKPARLPSGLRVREQELERFLAELGGESQPLTPPSPRATRGEGASDEDLVVVADGITIFDGRPRGARAVGDGRGA